MRTVNVTITELSEEQAYHLEKFLEKYYKVKDFKILPDTKELYENDEHYRKLTKAVKDATRIRNNYINEHNFK